MLAEYAYAAVMQLNKTRIEAKKAVGFDKIMEPSTALDAS